VTPSSIHVQLWGYPLQRERREERRVEDERDRREKAMEKAQ
jgi:hypothetical protein